MRKYKSKSNKKMYLLCILMLILTYTLSICYSTLSSNLEISGIVKVRLNRNIRVTGVKVEGSSEYGIFEWEEYDVKNVSGGIILPNEGSSITYKVEVTNFGNVDMGIYTIDGLDERLEYSIEGYTLKEKIKSGGTKKEIYITIKYKEGSYDLNNTRFNISLNFDFRPYYKIKYTGFTDDTNDLINEIIEGDTLVVDLNRYEKGNLKIIINGLILSENEYTFENNILTIPNIQDDVEVRYEPLPIYFDVISQISNIIFPRTKDEADTDIILTEDTTFNLVIRNNDGINFNNLDIKYQISVINSDKFTLEGGDTITKTLKGGEIIDDNITATLKIKDLSNTTDKVKIRVTSMTPTPKTFDFDYTVKQEGAIQYIEDLVALGLGIRGKTNPYNYTRENIQTQRFKLTRNLDFQDKSSYENANRTDFGDVNLNSITAGNIYEELNSETGFLPIGELEHTFQGVFNGDGHTLSNMRIHKSLQIYIGMFGTTHGATIKNFNIANGDVYNHNQAAGMLVGRVEGGLIENINIISGKVLSTDESNSNRDTYSGGIIGYVTNGATIRNCENHASVTTQFTGDAKTYSGPAGGITAWMAHSTIENCRNYGAVIGQSYVGGIAGFSGMQLDDQKNGGGKITNCENYGSVKTYITTQTGGLHVGGIAGYNKAGGIVETSTNYKDAVIYAVENAGGIVGYNMGTIQNCHNYSYNITVKTGSSAGKIYGKNTGTSSNNTNHAT